MEIKALFVDDEIEILSAFKRQLRGRFAIDTATSGLAGLELLTQTANYAVIVSDMHMPGMNGIEFLKQAHKKAPESVCLMLTGDRDQDLAVKAINEGHIFRFLNKPCSIDDLTSMLDACVNQHKLITAEKELLQHTLSGSVKVLTDILSMTDPVSFGQGLGLRTLIRQLAAPLNIKNPWDIELAAMLLGIGAVVIPDTVLAKHRQGLPLTPAEEQAVLSIPEKGKDLLSNIPRLEQVAKIVYYQNKNFDGSGFPPDKLAGEKIPLGARFLRILCDLRNLESSGLSRLEALAKLGERPGVYDGTLLNLLRDIEQKSAPASKAERKSFTIKIDQLCAGQVILAPVETKDGLLLLSPGSVLSPMAIDRLKNYHRFVGIKEPILVDAMIPVSEAEER